MRSFGARLSLVVAAGLVIRLTYALAVARTIQVGGDAYGFHVLGNLLAAGHGYIRPFDYVFSGRSLSTAEHPPLYPLYLALFSKLGATSFAWHRVASCLLGTATVAAIGLLGRRVGDDRAGLTSAAIAAVYPLLWVIDGSLMSESLYVLLMVLVALAALRLAERPGTGRASALGAVVGLATLTRGEAIFLIGLLAAPLAWRASSRWRSRLRTFALVCAGTAVVMAPWTARNWATFDRPVAVSDNTGTLLTGANCFNTYHGRELGLWRIDCIPPARARNEAVQAALWRDDGLRYARRHAGRLPVVIAVRVLRTWDLFRPRAQASYEVFEGRNRRAEQAGVLSYYVLLVLAIVGVALLRRRREVLIVLLAPAVLVTLASVIGYGITRFRAAAEPSIVVLTAIAIVALADRRQVRRV
ncbi:MAG TPA: glycosyltransferase family 39 protein [Solirubrobacteraceae bacterium]